MLSKDLAKAKSLYFKKFFERLKISSLVKVNFTQMELGKNY